MKWENVRVTSIDVDGQTAKVEHYIRSDNLKHEIGSHDPVGIYHPDLYHALQALRSPVVGMANLNPTWLDDGAELKVTGVSIQRDDKDGIKSVVVKLYHKPPELKTGLNVPVKVMAGEMGETFGELLRTLVYEAIGFVDGTKRGQVEMDLKDRKERAEKTKRQSAGRGRCRKSSATVVTCGPVLQS